ncbi:MAG: hypothetical protein FD135_3133 [Comamonadaceae bacterium]|nr:MAG: hypothetical protein FD135_3133 [Comamonadaceae bacterium]
MFLQLINLPRTQGLLVLLGAGLLLSAATVQAQAVYRIVGPDGKVSFSDKPVGAANNKVTPVENIESAAPSSTVTLPFELRQVVSKYPVMLYTSKSCAPCDSGRNLLTARGVPFTEKTITTALDAEALQKLSGATSLPFMTIGAQHVAGFSSTEWTQYLDVAGYPAQSKLPASYRAPAATPLVPLPVAAPKPAPAAPTPSATSTPPAPPRINPNNPAGIQF